MGGQIKVITAPAYEPVSRAEAKRWMKIDDTNSDNVVDLIIGALRARAENLTLRAFIPRTLRLYLDSYPADGVIRLPFPPLISVSSFKYRDLNGDLQTLAADQYDVRDWKEPAEIVPAYGVSWPSIRLTGDAIQITYEAGYPSGSPTNDETSQQVNIPKELRVWMEAQAATLFDIRHTIITGTIVTPLPDSIYDGLLDGLVCGDRLF